MPSEKSHCNIINFNVIRVLIPVAIVGNTVHNFLRSATSPAVFTVRRIEWNILPIYVLIMSDRFGGSLAVGMGGMGKCEVCCQI